MGRKQRQLDLLSGIPDFDPIFDAMRLGALSCARGEPSSKNPHKLHTILGHAWDSGWQEENNKPQTDTAYSDEQLDLPPQHKIIAIRPRVVLTTAESC